MTCSLAFNQIQISDCRVTFLFILLFVIRQGCIAGFLYSYELQLSNLNMEPGYIRFGITCKYVRYSFSDDLQLDENLTFSLNYNHLAGTNFCHPSSLTVNNSFFCHL